MTNNFNKLYRKYLRETLRFNTHLLVFLITLSLLWIVELLQWKEWGISWLIAVSLVWSLLLLIHFIIMRWNRGRVGKRKH